MDTVILSNKPHIPNSVVRVLLFKECRLKERQLLFDSSISNDLKIINTQMLLPTKIPCSKFGEEYSTMSELIFGSTAMRFHGTYYKIHNLSSPQKMLFTQVFPTPSKKRLENSETVLKINKSYLGSYNSEREDSLFERRGSTPSESLISIFRKSDSDRSNTMSTIDSGFTEQSLSSIPTTDTQFSISSRNYSSAESFKEHLRVSSCQTDGFDSMFPTSFSSHCCVTTKTGYSRIGLAIVFAVPEEEHLNMQLCLCYTYFIERLLSRIRQYLEFAINSSKYFLSVMNNITQNVLDELSRFLIVKNAQHNAARSKVDFTELYSKEFKFSCLRKVLYEKLSHIAKRKTETGAKQAEEDFFRDWCRPLMELNNKEKKFFLSYILTAVLTFHHGWISTCYQTTSIKQNVSMRNSYNSLWYQLMDYCGVIEHNQKPSHVVIYSSTNKDDVIKDTVQFLRYFIRYFRVQNRQIEREHIEEDHNEVNIILDSKKRRRSSSGTNRVGCVGAKNTTSALTRTKTISSNLVKLASLGDSADSVQDDDPVIFILGDNEKLVNLKDECSYEEDSEDSDEIKTSSKKLETNSLLEEQETTSGLLKKCESTQRSKNKKMNVISFPLPRTKVCQSFVDIDPYAFSLDKKSMENFSFDCVLQGYTLNDEIQEPNFKKNPFSYKKSRSSETNLEEILILGDIDDCHVDVMSGNRKQPCDTLDISHYVADMLEIAHEMRKLGIPQAYCLTHIEQRLQELCLKSSALANLLLTTDFCTMDFLLSSLDIEISEVSLLMSIASNLYPEIVKKYGISYQ